jgi:virginiamycin B lyase
MSQRKNRLSKILVIFYLPLFLIFCLATPSQAKTRKVEQFQSSLIPGTIVEYSVPLPNYSLGAITSGPDGALWFTGGKQVNSEIYVGRITTDGVITQYPVDNASYLFDITTGPDGNLWFTNPGFGIGRITLSGVVTNFTRFGIPFHIVNGSDGALWFTELLGHSIGRISTDGQVTGFMIPNFVQPVGVRPAAIALGPDGNIWFGELLRDNIGRITPSGVITEFPFPAINSTTTDMTVGADGALWFTMWGDSAIGRYTIGGNFTRFPIPDGANPYSIVSGPDGALWFTDENKSRVSRMTMTGELTHFPFPTQGSGSRGIAVGNDGNIWFVEGLNNRVGKVILSTFDLCIEDESNGNRLQVNTTTGEYQFTNCSGVTLGGTGTLKKRGSTLTLQHISSDRRVTVTIDTSTNRATASLQVFSQGRIFSITDRNILNNVCSCN